MQVLLVEDHPQARQLELAMAQSLGWKTDVTSSGEHAMALIEARQVNGSAPYQVIFMDEEMGGMDGWESSRRLRLASAPTPPLIIMLATHPRQALSQRKEAELALLAGYLVKPVTAGMLSQALERALDGHVAMRNQTRKTLPTQNKLGGLRLLVVEDNPLNQRVMQELLRNEGAVVEIADNGEASVAAIAQAKPPFDAVLMDLQMPVMDGYGATRVIRNELGLTSLPVIALSANTSQSDRQACLDAGMNDHVGKPFDMRHLVNVLLSHTGRDCEADAGPGTPPVSPEADDNRIILDESVLQRLGGNPVMLSELLQSYMSEISSLPDQLEALLQKGDFKGASQLAHTLIGISAIVGTKHMAAVARQTSNKLKAGLEPAEQHPLCCDFRAAVLLTCNALTPFMENLPAPM
jgi:CheY-like chemotaxis protein